MDAVQRRFGNTAEQACRQRAGSSLPHACILVAYRQDKNTACSPEAGEVPCAHRPLDKIVIQCINVGEHKRVKRPVEPKRHKERINKRYGYGEYEWCMQVEPSEDNAQAVADPDTQRAEQECCYRDHDQHRQEGDENELHAAGDDLLRAFIDKRKYSYHEQRHEDIGRIII